MPEKSMILHDSQMECYRSPGGSVCAKTRVKLCIDVAAEQKMTSVMIRVWQENVGETLLPMEKSRNGERSFRYSRLIDMPDSGCLIWYYFILSGEGKPLFYGNNAERLGGEGKLYDQNPAAFQITVYNEGAVTPTWFKNAVMYQIFPDRFARKGNVLPEKKDALIHSTWGGNPGYFKDVDTKEMVAYDFFGGNIAGIKEKLSYLKELGISVIYFNPVFESPSNHRYDTGNYHKIDPLFGTNEEFVELCNMAKKMGIRIILDGVFSHTGSDSKYFNREENYDTVGAFQSVESPYYDWYDFKKYPYEYNSWWGFSALPNVKETTASYMDFIINNDDSVLKYWLKQGISGWRLDVLDELPAVFSQRFFQALKAENPDNVLIGEVWEDASNKISYGTAREYLCGKEVDSVMNYPFRQILLDFILGKSDAGHVSRQISSLVENYPKENFYAMMNLIGSHDVERVLTLLGEAPFYDGMPAIHQAQFRLNNDRYQLAVARLKVLLLWQMSFPGVPSIYYGDEAGMQGFRDPYNRGPYIWGKEDEYLREWYKKIIRLRNQYQALRTGEFIPICEDGDVYGYVRRIVGGKDVFDQKADDGTFLILLNRSGSAMKTVTLDVRGICQGMFKDMLGNGDMVKVVAGKITMQLLPLQGMMYRQEIDLKFERSAGVLLHPTSLPSQYGIGDFGKQAYEFVNFLVKARQKIWQILPLNPVGYSHSPYQSPSAFAGNPMLISLGKLVVDTLLTANEVKVPFEAEKVGFEQAGKFKGKCLRLAYKKFVTRSINKEYKEFCQEQKKWLEDYVLFMALKKHFGETEWNTWESGLVTRNSVVLDQYRKLLADEMNYQRFLQYEFFKQWKALKNYANQRGVKIVGDMPIFIAHDSADVWANQGLFSLDKTGCPEKVAGVPPDYFSATGQLWGNPHYRWDKMKEDDYAWWRERFAALFGLVDFIRVDHFRGFEAYWEVDGDAKTAIVGKWVKGPGARLFQMLEKYFGKLPIIAEDLGIITDEVDDLKDEFSFPGMKVLHFKLYLDEAGEVGFSCEKNCVVYTGTHDNNTTVGWLTDDLDEKTLSAVGKLLEVDPTDTKATCWELVRFAYASNASLTIVPVQDLLALGSEARMNMPGTVGTNWQWCVPQNMFTDDLAEKLAALCKTYQR